MSISIGLDTAMRALLAQQLGVDTVSHNISNVNTPGYSRQRVALASIPGIGAYSATPGPGGGVEVEGVDRVRDLFIDFQVRSNSHALGRYRAQANQLVQAEAVLAEPSEFGLRSLLTQFWNAWRDLADSPELPAARSAVVEAASTVSFALQQASASFARLRVDADVRVRSLATEVNALSSEVAGLNREILAQRAGGGSAADLSDRRDLALDRLADVVDTHYLEQQDGTVDVFLGGRALVTGVDAWSIYADPNIANNNYADLKFVADDGAVVVRDGEVRALLDERDVGMPGRIAELDQLAGQIITDVNTAHAAGFGLDGPPPAGAQNFFTGTDAGTIAVDVAVQADLNLIAASTNALGAPGDSSNAGVISDLQYAFSMSGGTATYDQFYNGVVTRLGSAVRESERQVESQELTIEHLELLRQSTSGVNLDEEMVQLMQYQRAYEAASRLISTIDEMLDTLINRTI
jgi:flagellar hook-associated protein 1 FlgK